MIYQEKTQDLVAEYTSLSLAISKLIEKQEKDWGCFQVKKEGDFSSLYIPSLPSFKLYQNPKSLIYRGYWRQANELPIPTDTKSFPPDFWIKKKQKKVRITQGTETKKVEDREQELIYEFKSETKDKPLKKVITVEKKQRIYEIVYRYNSILEIRVVNQLVANFLKEKIIASIVAVPEGEIFPLVLVSNPE